MIISGFPGVGKTYYHGIAANSVSDSDSSKFSWIKEGVRNPDFPQNYIKHIKGLIGKVNIIFVSSHKAVRNALVANGLEFTLVFPEADLKDEYLQRFRRRGNADSFIQMIDDKWDSFMEELVGQKGCRTVRLKSGEYLSDCGVLNQKEIVMAKVPVYYRPGSWPVSDEEVEAMNAVAEKFGAERCFMWLIDENKATDFGEALDAVMDSHGLKPVIGIPKLS